MSRVLLTIGYQTFLLESSSGVSTLIAALSKCAEVHYERHEERVTVYRVEDPPKIEMEPVTSRMRFVSKRPACQGGHRHESAAPLQPDEDEVSFVDVRTVQKSPKPGRSKKRPPAPALPPSNVLQLPPPQQKALPPQRTFFLE